MSKRLVKTAQQQLEERLRSLTVLTTYKGVKDVTLYLCEDEHKQMSILRESEEWGRNEYKFQGSYQSMIESEEFLYAITCRFNEIGEPVKNIFDWYASADKDLTPFTVYDILQLDLYLESETVTFGDIYEEVPDVRVITAQEQWEKESTGAETISTLSNGSVYKVMQTDASLTFFVHQNGEYFKEVYPPLEELRKDAHFAMAYLSHVRAMHDSDLCSALDWIQTGNYTMDGLTLLDIYEVTNCKDHVCYHDKEEPSQKSPCNVVEMNMYDPFNWLRAEGCGIWEIITEYCNNEKEYGRLDALYRIIEGTLNVEDEFCNPPTEEEIKEDYQKNFPLLLAGVFENLADAIRKGELTFVMDYSMK